MKIRFYLDPDTQLPHIYNHQVSENEVEDVLTKPAEDRPGHDGVRISLGQTRVGRYLRVIYVPDPQPGSIFVITAYELSGKPLVAFRRRKKEKELSMKKKNKFPAGWDEERVKQVLTFYEKQTEEEAVAEDEAAFEHQASTTMEVPVDLVPAVRELIAKYQVSSETY